MTRRVNQIKAGVILSYVSMFLGYFIAILYSPIMLRLLGQKEYGLYNLVSSVVGYLGLFNFGFSSAYFRYFSKYRINNDYLSIEKLNGMFLLIFTFISLIALICGTILVKFTRNIFNSSLSIEEIGKAEILLSILVVHMAFSLLTTVFSTYITAQEEYVYQKIAQLVRLIFSPMVILPLLFLGYKSVGMVISTTIIGVLSEISNIAFCFSKLKMRFRFKGLDLRVFADLSVFSSFIFINMLVDQINWNVDKFIIGRFRGTIQVAIYGVATMLNGYYMSFSSAISHVFVPRVNRLIALNDNESVNRLFIMVGRIQFMVLSLLCSGFIFFGSSFIKLWAGEEYSSAYQILVVLMIPVTVPLIQNIGIEIQRAKNQHRFRSLIYLFISIFNILISIPLTQAYGGFGAAIGTAIAVFIGNGLIMNWYYYHRTKIDIPSFWKQISLLLPSLIIPILLGLYVLLYVRVESLMSFALFVVIYTFVFFASLFLFGMNRYEKDLLLSPSIKVTKMLFRVK